MPKIRLQHFMIFFMENFENIFPEKSIEIKYKNIHSWMPNSLLKLIKTNHVLYKLSITKPTKINQATYKNYNNKLKEKLSEINKSDMKKKAMFNKIIKQLIVNYR